jgi:hypothetical protein
MSWRSVSLPSECSWAIRLSAASVVHCSKSRRQLPVYTGNVDTPVKVYSENKRDHLPPEKYGEDQTTRCKIAGGVQSKSEM